MFYLYHKHRYVFIEFTLSLITTLYSLPSSTWLWIFYFRYFNLDILECESDPCQHDGNCTERIKGYSCDCETGYIGSQCAEGKYIEVFYKAKCYDNLNTVFIYDSLYYACIVK